MDDFGKILQDLVKNLPQDAAAPAKPAQDAQDALSAEGMAMPAMPELSSILGKLPPPMPMNNRKLQLLAALKPYMRPSRQEQIDRAQSLLRTAYSMRALLSSLGGGTHV